MADVNPMKLKGVVAAMMERQAQELKAPPSGVIGGLWEKATGEIQKYNEAATHHVEIKTKFDAVMQKLKRTQEEADELTKQLRDGLIEEGEAAEEARQKLKALTDQVESLTSESEEMAESVDQSTQALEMMNKGGGILRNGMVALAAKVGGAAASFYGFREAITTVDDSLKLGSKTVGDFGSRYLAPTLATTLNYEQALFRVASAAWDWHNVVKESSWELMKFGINAEETRNIIGTYADGLRLTTTNQHNLIQQTQQMTEDTGFLSKLLRVNTDELANATVDASRRFGKSTTEMADDLAGLYVSVEQIKLTSRDTVVSFSDLTRATLEAQSSFQGYNFNLRSTANILGNVVARAQEQGATYEMSMKAAEGLAGVITGGKAPDWAKYIAGRDMLSAARKAVEDVKKEGLGKGLREELGKQFKIKPEELAGLSDIQVQLAKQFSLDPTTKAGKAQLKGLENLTKNYKKYGALSSAKMAEELLRGTEQSNEAMFGMMKKMADKPEGRELLMRVWGLDEAAATAATLALHTADSVEDFTKIQQEAKSATAGRKPVSAADLKEQTGEYTKAISQAQAGIVGQLTNILSALKVNPMISGAIGVGGTVTSVGVQALQSGLGEMVGKLMAESRIGQTGANVAGRAYEGIRSGAGRLRAMTTGRGPTVSEAFGRMFGRGGGGMYGPAPAPGPSLGSRAMTGLSKAATGVTDGFKAAGKGLKAMRTGLNAMGGPITNVVGKLGQMGGPMAALAGKAGLVGLAGAAGVAVGSLIRLIPGVDSFTEGLINSAAKLFGFEGALDKAETAQAALSNKSEGVQRAIKNVTAGITTDYEKDSLARMKARVQLENATKEDLEAYAKKIASTGKLTEEEAMVRLEKLAGEKVDYDKLRKLREEESQKNLETERTGATELMKARMDASKKMREGGDTTTAEQLDQTGAALLTPKESQPMPSDMPLVMPPASTGMTKLPSPAGWPESPQAKREARHREEARRQQQRRQGGGGQPRTGRASVRPDGSINLNIMIPRDALDQSNTQSDGYVR